MDQGNQALLPKEEGMVSVSSAEKDKRDNIANLMQMGFQLSEVQAALNATKNDPNLAYEFLRRVSNISPYIIHFSSGIFH